MTNIFEATEKFMRAAGQLDVIGFPSEYSHPVRQLRRELIREEDKEYFDGELIDDEVEVADGLVDKLVTTWGTMLSYFGPELSALLCETVGDSNLSKILADGSVLKREDGKVLKPEGYKPPRIPEILEAWYKEHPRVDPSVLDAVSKLDKEREGLA